MSDLANKKDLTRWNRAGLNRFRYVDGNAVTYLEALRLMMKEAFTVDGENKWSELDTKLPVPNSETDSEQSERWLAQYRDDRRDYAWEILRTYGRSIHVLMEHLDAYSNESFLRTATEWEHVRRLVEMIDYHPAPPASAQTHIALLVKEGLSGTLDRGFAVKNKPVDGSKAAIFETLVNLEVASELNELRAEKWDRSQLPFNLNFSSREATLKVGEPLEDVSVGSLGVIEISNASGITGIPVSVTSTSETHIHMRLEISAYSISETMLDSDVTVYFNAENKRTPRIIGDDVISITEGHGLSVNAVIAWKVGSNWYSSKVTEVESERVRLSSSTMPPSGKTLYITDFATRQRHRIGGADQVGFVLPTRLNSMREFPNAVWDENLNPVTDDGHTGWMFGPENEFDFKADSQSSKYYYIPNNDGIATVVQSGVQALIFDGKPKKLNSGDWVIAEVRGSSQPRLAKVEQINEIADGFEITLDSTINDVEVIYHQFAHQTKPLDYDKNDEPVFLTETEYRSDLQSVIPLDSRPESLVIKRKVLFVSGENAHLATIKAIDEVNNYITVAPALPCSKTTETGTTEIYTRYKTKIYGNVAEAGHGETQNMKVLGSGDASKSNQTFHLVVDDASFVIDSLFSAGVRADLTVKVGTRTYSQVDNLNDSSAEDPHYTVRMREDKTLDISFGDGRKARRLPTGANNITVLYRKGSGLVGNLASFSLEKEVKPHYLIESFFQPVAASGGNDMESAESMREHAPASVLTLERAVSLADFAHLAENNASVWQAVAKRQIPDFSRLEKVLVAVVPAGGGELGTLGDSLASTLMSHCLPDVIVSVEVYIALLLSFEITVRVKTDEYDIDEVEANVKTALFDAFSLQNSKLGMAFYRSQVFQIVESVIGVENCQCKILNTFIDEAGNPAAAASVALSADNQVKRITPQWNQVIYLSESLSTISLTMLAYTP